jgi:membrane-associated protein
MIPGVDLIDFIKWGGVIAVALVIFAESGLLIGFFLPGDSLLFTAGFLTYTGFLPINIHLLVLILFLAAVTGDSVGYTFGRRLGPSIFKKPDARLFKQEYIQKAQEFYEKHGGKTIILARFVPIVRTFAPIVAGTAQMPYKRFLTFNLIGGLLWTAGITYTGYFLGKVLRNMGIEIDHIILPIIAIIILLSIVPPTIHLLRDKKQRQALWNGTKREFNSLFNKK